MKRTKKKLVQTERCKVYCNLFVRSRNSSQITVGAVYIHLSFFFFISPRTHHIPPPRCCHETSLLLWGCRSTVLALFARAWLSDPQSQLIKYYIRSSRQVAFDRTARGVGLVRTLCLSPQRYRLFARINVWSPMEQRSIALSLHVREVKGRVQPRNACRDSADVFRLLPVDDAW